jgi:hypothetical protein
MRTRNLFRWLMLLFLPLMTTVLGTTTCSFRGEGDIDDDDGGGVIIIDDD